MSSVISIKNADEGIFSGGGIGAPAYRAGNGIYIKDYNISVKYDNQTIKINNENSTLGIKYDSNTLRVGDNGLTADPYTAGSALKIVNRQVSVQVDNESIKVNNGNQLYVDKEVVGDKYWKEEDVETHILPAEWYLNFTKIDKQGIRIYCKYDGEISDEQLEKFPKQPSNIIQFTINRDNDSPLTFTISCYYDSNKQKYIFRVPLLMPKTENTRFSESGIDLNEYLDVEDFEIITLWTDDTWSDVLELYYPDKMVIVDGLQSIESVLTPTTDNSHIYSTNLTVEEDIMANSLTANSYITIADKQIKHIDGYSYEFTYSDLEQKDLGNGYIKLCFKSIITPTEDAYAIGIELPSYMRNDEGKSLGTITIWYNTSTNKWICPMIRVREGIFSIVNDQSDECGFGVSNNYTNPLQLYLRGEIFIKVLLPSDTLDANSSITCKTIIAENAIPLYKTPLPYLFNIIDIGQISIDEPYQIPYESGTFYFHHDLWYIDFGYTEDSEEFKALIDGQSFEFTDGAFGTSFSLTKRNGSWEGNNYCVYCPMSSSPEEQSGDKGYAVRFEFYRDNITWRVLQTLYHYEDEQASDPWFYLLSASCSVRLSTGYSGGKQEPSTIQGNFEITSYGTVNRNGTLYEYIEFMNKQYDGKSSDNSNNYLAKITETDSEVWEYYKNNSNNISITLTIEFPENQTQSYTLSNICETGVGSPPRQMNLRIKERPNYLTVHAWQWNIRKYLNIIDNQGLRLYLDYGAFWKINSNDYEYGNNPFAFIATNYDYTVIPAPESCSRFECPYNFIVNGIVIGDNIETHAFALNNVGNNVEVMMNQVQAIIQEIQYIEQYLQALAAEIAALSTMFDFMMIMDAAFAVGEGLITGISMAAQAIMKFGAKTAMKATEAGMEVGEAMAKTEIKSGETAVKKLTATGEIEAKGGMSVSKDFTRLDENGNWVYKTSLNEQTGTFTVELKTGEKLEYRPFETTEGVQQYFRTYKSTLDCIFRDEKTNERAIRQLWGVNPTNGEIDFEIISENQRLIALNKEGISVSKDFTRLNDKGEWVYTTSLNEETGTFTVELKTGEKLEYRPFETTEGVQQYFRTYNEKTNEHIIRQLWGVNPTNGEVDYQIAIENKKLMELSKNTQTGTESVSALDSAIVAEKDTTGEVSTTFSDSSGKTVAKIDKDGLSAERLHVRTLEGTYNQEYEIYIDENGNLVKENKNLTNAGFKEIDIYTKDGNKYLKHVETYTKDGKAGMKTTIEFDSESQARQCILNDTGIDIATGKIQSSILDGSVKITVDGDATALDLRNATVALRDKEGNLIAQVGSNSEKRLAVSDSEGTVAEVATDSIDQKVKLIIKRLTKFEYYVQAATILIKAIKASLKGQEASDTGIDITYTAGSITLTTLSNEFTLFGHTYKGFANKNDPTTWTSDYLIDASILASLESRISALENRLN